MRLLKDRVLVRRVPQPTETESGIYTGVTPTTQQADFGVVDSIGPDVDEVAVGDCIAFALYTGDPVQVGGETLLVLRPGDIFAVVEL